MRNDRYKSNLSSYNVIFEFKDLLETALQKMYINCMLSLFYMCPTTGLASTCGQEQCFVFLLALGKPHSAKNILRFH